MSKHFFPVVTITKQSRIEKRRSEGLDVLGFVDALLHGLNEIEIFTEPARFEADQKAQAEAEEREQEKLYEENQRHLTAFWEKNPPASLFPTFTLKVNSSMF